MQAGKLNRKITIERPSTAQDAFGAPAASWSKVLDCWAHIAALTGREVYSAGAGFSGQLTHKITVRYTVTPIGAGMRVRYRSKTFLVQAPPMDPDEANQQLDLLCLEQAP